MFKLLRKLLEAIDPGVEKVEITGDRTGYAELDPPMPTDKRFPTIVQGAHGSMPCGEHRHKPELAGVMDWPNGKGRRHIMACRQELCTWTFTFDAF